MSSINQKMGLKPRTRARMATHGKHLRPEFACPSCRAHRVREYVALGIVTQACDACFAMWRPGGEPLGTYRDGVGTLRYERCLCPYPTHAPICRKATA